MRMKRRRKRARDMKAEQAGPKMRKWSRKDQFNSPLSQEQWNLLGKDSRIRVRKENPTNETSYFCQ